MHKKPRILAATAILVSFAASSALAYPPDNRRRSPSVAQEVDQKVRDAKSENASLRRSLSAADRVLSGAFEREYQSALAMVCQGHCSPGITEALQRMHSAVDSASANLGEADSNSKAIDSDLSEISQIVDRAQGETNDFRY